MLSNQALDLVLLDACDLAIAKDEKALHPPMTASFNLPNGQKIFLAEETPIGTGNSTAVYKFKNLKNKEYAVKRIRTQEKEIVSKSKLEQKFSKRANGYCVRAESYDAESNYYTIDLIMPMAQGGTFDSVFAILGPADKLSFFIAILVELKKQLHDKGMSHEDLNEVNIFINTELCKIYFIDFGDSKEINGPSDTLVDIHQLGTILSDCITEEHGFEGIAPIAIDELKMISKKMESGHHLLVPIISALQLFYYHHLDFFMPTMTLNGAYSLIKNMLEYNGSVDGINYILGRLSEKFIIRDLLSRTNGLSLFAVAIYSKNYEIIKAWAAQDYLPDERQHLNKIFGACVRDGQAWAALFLLQKKPKIIEFCHRISDRHQNNILHLLVNGLEKKCHLDYCKLILKILTKHPDLLMEKNEKGATPFAKLSVLNAEWGFEKQKGLEWAQLGKIISGHQKKISLQLGPFPKHFVSEIFPSTTGVALEKTKEYKGHKGKRKIMPSQTTRKKAA